MSTEKYGEVGFGFFLFYFVFTSHYMFKITMFDCTRIVFLQWWLCHSENVGVSDV